MEKGVDRSGLSDVKKQKGGGGGGGGGEVGEWIKCVREQVG